MALPVALLEALKTPLDELVLRESEMPPVPAVALLPYWSASWKPSAVLVVDEALGVVGVGVITTWVGEPGVLVVVKFTVLVPPAEAACCTAPRMSCWP